MIYYIVHLCERNNIANYFFKLAKTQRSVAIEDATRGQ